MNEDYLNVPTKFRNILFNSYIEARWAYIFTRLKWEWKYKPFRINNWTPDFILQGNSKPVLVKIEPINSLDEFEGDIPWEINGYFVALFGFKPIFRDVIQMGWSMDNGYSDDVVLKYSEGLFAISNMDEDLTNFINDSNDPHSHKAFIDCDEKIHRKVIEIYVDSINKGDWRKIK